MSEGRYLDYLPLVDMLAKKCAESLLTQRQRQGERNKKRSKAQVSTPLRHEQEGRGQQSNRGDPARRRR